MPEDEEIWFSLAETSSNLESSGHYCGFAHERNKAELEDFSTILNGSEKYTDNDFYHDSSALYWADIGESN